ncbi:MAG: peptidylprolyl isomerase [bacterium]|nr:peptidylprolyl isomerase [bacterium]
MKIHILSITVVILFSCVLMTMPAGAFTGNHQTKQCNGQCGDCAKQTEGDDVVFTSADLEGLFSEYAVWPPESITDEEKEILRNVVVVFETTKGVIRMKMFPDEAPIHSANFVKLAMDGYFDGIVFHRVITGFVSQGGDPTGTGEGGPDYTLPAEISLPHMDGSIGAARTGDDVNPERRSSGSQFYFCHTTEGTSRLDGKYTVFGEIVSGQDVNLSLNVTYTREGPIEGAVPDKIIRAWVEIAQPGELLPRL